ncbi:unnamed protein product [Rangifer tarandus platyrhynchus]|uniref:Uncharacterized protein n=1 Tax=Rangifer tarandus platyrhynchus TaxID=3082113 RepID=A0ABN8Z329_RANTA|nr:unnamed protein product [Rangifer tarandus platyrhynchus]
MSLQHQARTPRLERSLPTPVSKGQTPYLGAGAPGTIGGAAGPSGRLGDPASSLVDFPGGKRGCATASLRTSPGAAGRRKVRAEEEGRRRAEARRWAQISEAFLASQWLRGAGRSAGCAGGDAALLRRQLPA